MLRPGRARLSHAAQLLGVLVCVAVGGGRVGRVRHLREQLVAIRLGGRELGLEHPQLLLDRRERLELLGRRLALQLQLRAQLLDARQQRPPALVRREQRIEALGGALARKGRAETLRIGACGSEVDQAFELTSASITAAAPSSAAGGQTQRASSFTRGSAFSTAMP